MTAPIVAHTGRIRPTDPKPTIGCPCGYVGPCTDPVIEWGPNMGGITQGRCPKCNSHQTIREAP
jgi:hypothetical protein